MPTPANKPTSSVILAGFLDAWEQGQCPPLPDDPPLAQLVANARAIWENLDQQPIDTITPLAPTDTLPQTIGRFTIIRELGRGGFGVVYLAHDPTMNRWVALKVPLLAALLMPDARKRFLREAELAAPLDHPNIVPVYEAGELGPLAYLASAYVPGLSLADWLEQHRRAVDPEIAAAFVAAIADGVQHAHHRGVLHRDLKPGNVLLQAEDADTSAAPESATAVTHNRLSAYRPRVTDFGLGRAIDGQEQLSQTGQMIGTASYMAPEQAKGQRHAVDVRTDVWGLGVILYELLTGQRPFTGDSIPAVVHQTLHAEPPRPRSLCPTLSADLEAVCLRCLEKDPAKRYRSAEALAADLRQYLAGEPTEARPLGRVASIWRWVKRRPATVTIGTLVTLVLILGPMLLVRLMGLQSILDERDKTEAATKKLADERERSILVEQIHRRLMEKPDGWIQANLADIAGVNNTDTTDYQKAALRSDIAATLAGVEWREIARLAPDSRTECTVYSPDGRTLAAGTSAVGTDGMGTITLYDAHTLQVKRTLRYPKHNVATTHNMPRSGPDGTRALIYSPDGKYLYHGTRSGYIQRFTLANTSDQPDTSWHAHKRTVNTLCISPEGDVLYSASEAENAVAMWSLPSGQRKDGFTATVDHNVAHDLSLEHLGNQLLYVLSGKDVWWLNLKNVQPEPPRLPNGEFLRQPSEYRLVGRSSYSPMAEAILFGERGVWLWDAQFRTFTVELAGDRDAVLNEEYVHSPRLDHRGRYAAVLLDNEVVFWDVTSATILTRRALPPLGNIQRHISFSRDGERMVISGQPMVVLERRAALAEQMVAVQAMPIRCFALAEQVNAIVSLSTHIVTAGQSVGTIKQWSLNDPTAVRTLVLGHTCMPYPVLAVTPEAQTLAWASHTDWLECTDMTTNTVRYRQHFESISAEQRSFALTADGQACWAARGSQVVCHGLNCDEVLHTMTVPRSARGIHQVWALAVGSQFLLAGNRDGQLDIADPTGRILTTANLGDKSITAVVLSHDQTTAIVGRLDGQVCTVSIPDGQVHHTFTPHQGRINALALSSDRRLLYTGGTDGRLRCWLNRNGEWVWFADLPTGNRAVRQLTLDARGQKLYVLLTGERGIRVWDTTVLERYFADFGLRESLPPSMGASIIRPFSSAD